MLVLSIVRADGKNGKLVSLCGPTILSRERELFRGVAYTSSLTCTRASRKFVDIYAFIINAAVVDGVYAAFTNDQSAL